MAENRINATLSPADREAVLKAVATIKEKLPFLIDLSKDERIALPKLGDKSRAFVVKALEVATQNPDILPRYFDVDEMRRDVELFEALYPIVLSLSQLQALIDDTCLAAGSEAYVAALTVYNYAKVSGNTQGLDAALDELGRRFARKTKKPEAPAP
ncbi:MULTISPECIES: hypothetical protein [Cylindrospermum]|uniref:Uncharacterized protein n=1 Tax=Cylindrospermum stagnale PCC 7417 TaxID=56107 RepID=K9X697_9NOST|nr:MULTISPECIES: hypothetical protein [Cylindrospermum]AFZ27152.1 hypothetical protein Cylst_5107 [Cylindrospermum stagnale PCC 7417]MBD2384548.1 hypothetical protein [Cylindrospermum sp. FACHB-282]